MIQKQKKQNQKSNFHKNFKPNWVIRFAQNPPGFSEFSRVNSIIGSIKNLDRLRCQVTGSTHRSGPGLIRLDETIAFYESMGFSLFLVLAEPLWSRSTQDCVGGSSTNWMPAFASDNSRQHHTKLPYAPTCLCRSAKHRFESLQ